MTKAKRKPSEILPNIHNFSGAVWTTRGLRQVEDLVRKAMLTGRPEAGTIETMRTGMKRVVAQANGMVTD